MIAATLLAAALAATAEPAPAPPNVVLIVADDLGWRDLGCYGATAYRSPRLDRLAAEGVRFTDAYSAGPNCSPSRAALLTGLYPGRTGLTDIIAGRIFPHQRFREPSPLHALPAALPTLAQALAARGYATAHFGKWHLGGDGHLPSDHGFALNLGGNARGFPKSWYPPYQNPQLPDGPEREHIDDRLAREAAGFLAQEHGRPFFIHLAFHTVHTPLHAEPALLAEAEARLAQDRSQSNPVYAGMVGHLDRAVGTVLDAIDARGLRASTLVLFVSDNGGLLGEEGRPVTSNHPLRAGKGVLYEGGIRVPFIVRLPGGAQAGTVSAAPVGGVDVMPTILAAAGEPPEELARRWLDGRDLGPQLRAGDAAAPERPLFWHYPHYNYVGGFPSAAVRRGGFKLLADYQRGVMELYDLATDPGETRDLAAERPAEAQRLSAELAAWQHAVGAQMPVPNPDHDPADPGRGARWGLK